ncbi:alpha/beta fold hydrolase [Qipengyuania qiaonensis]|nr:alpha/beta hydrolase [Qipengyuania qiaonensis]
MVRILGALSIALIAAFFILRVPDTDPEEMVAKYGAPPSQMLAIDNDRRVHVRDEGPRDAPVIVLLHGSNADLHTWQQWTDALTNEYRVIRFDQRGHGLTGAAPDDDYTLDSFVNDVRTVADTLQIERFTLVGNSMGGAVAMGYAIAHPDRLDALVLVDAGGAPITKKGDGNLAFRLAAMPGIGNIMSQFLPRSLIEKSLSQSVSNQAVVTQAAVDRYWELARYPGNRAATRQRFSTPRKTFDAAAIEGVRIPTLVMWGEEDTLIPYEAAGWYMEHLPNATLASYRGIGHLPMEEASEASVADLKNWLENTGLSARSRTKEPPVGPSVLTP